jgi:hypothetical protein
MIAIGSAWATIPTTGMFRVVSPVAVAIDLHRTTRRPTNATDRQMAGKPSIGTETLFRL